MSNDKKKRRVPPGMKLVFCMSFVHRISGKVVRRKDGKPFCFLVPK